MVIPKINSAHGSDTRNILNRAIDSINAQGKSIQDLVAEGQLTPTQYAQLITAIDNRFYNTRMNGDPIGANDLTSELLALIEGGEGANFDLKSIPRIHSVSPFSTNFLTVGKNLFNKENTTIGKSLEYSTGNIRDSQWHELSEEIPITPGEKYTQSHSMVIIFTNIDGGYIEGHPQESPHLKLPRTITAPLGADSARIGVTKEQVDNFQFEKGENSTEYENFFVKFNVDAKIEHAELEKGSITLEHVDFIERSTNIFNKDNVTNGKSVDPSDTVIDNPNFSYSDFEKINANTLTTIHVMRINIYDDDYNILSSYVPTDYIYDIPFTFTFSDSAAYYRANVETAKLDIAQVNEGSELLPYEKYGVDFKNPKNTSGSSNPTVANKKYAKTIKEVYTAPLKQSMVPGDSELKTTDVSGFYAKYDALVTKYPNYVSKTLLKNDLDGNPIYRYDFKPVNIPTVDNELPKFLITTGTHGGERHAMWTAFNMFEDICERWKDDVVLETLRFNVHIVVIPLVNPFSFISKQNDTSNGRHNKNGVDIPRNFPTTWIESEGLAAANPESVTYRGVAALSEIETQAVWDVYQEGGWSFVTDYHNFFSNPNENYFTWIGGTDEFSINMGQRYTMKMANKWKQDREYFAQDENVATGYVDGTNVGIYREAQEDGVLSSLTETCVKLMVEPNMPTYSQDAMTLGTEAITNWIYTAYVNVID